MERGQAQGGRGRSPMFQHRLRQALPDLPQARSRHLKVPIRQAALAEARVSTSAGARRRRTLSVTFVEWLPFSIGAVIQLFNVTEEPVLDVPTTPISRVEHGNLCSMSEF